MPTLNVILQVIFGLVATLLLGLAVKPLLDYAKKSMPLPPPSEGTATQWAAVTGGNEGGRYLGHLERLLFFCAFMAGAEAVVAGWLAFKVASKWNVWTNVVAVPKELPGIEPLDYLVARRSWGSHVLMTFLLGTLANVLAAFLGVLVARHGYLALKVLLSCQ
jgi:hypothetical protein